MLFPTDLRIFTDIVDTFRGVYNSDSCVENLLNLPDLRDP